jgi:hypothetical protein
MGFRRPDLSLSIRKQRLEEAEDIRAAKPELIQAQFSILATSLDL